MTCSVSHSNSTHLLWHVVACRFDPMVAQLLGAVSDCFVYLHALPKTCVRRMVQKTQQWRM